ncbi:hypothetical protein [Roseomonas haemaphysalidis]|uniref:Phosphatidate cytidylyltransferase n=1 Tax=Roseomonas haemaphysalidis TaxID=2768162 RepID=A0ABS3KKQ3_9PROT|nr:hypothetical protein [Roseomonas haemaphysalidis]MBO1078046.1 hypothetical protein [Roseomonas haemaphysalidis]
MTPRDGWQALEARAAAGMAVPRPASPAMRAALALSDRLRLEHGDAIAAILFYGSARRTGEADGLLDLYVLYDDHRRFHRRWLPSLLNAALPPTVLLRTAEVEGLGAVRAKVAVLSRRQFARRLRPGSWDTTIWARFCQPVTLLHARGEAEAAWVAQSCAQAFATAALWAVWLGPPGATPAERWQGLFARTYGAELRTERGSRAVTILDAAPDWFDGGLPFALAAQGLPGAPPPPGRAERGWRWRRRFGKALNVARLVKAAFTFEGGADYLAWKIQRHTGQPLPLTPWQRRHPVLAAPLLLWRLRRQGLVR